MEGETAPGGTSTQLEAHSNPQSELRGSSSNSQSHDGTEPNACFNRPDILRALEVVERDSVAIAESFTSLFASLRLALSEVTSTSVDHMRCFFDASGRLQESTLDAATRGNRYINSCLRLNEEMRGTDGLATQMYPSGFI